MLKVLMKMIGISIKSQVTEAPKKEERKGLDPELVEEIKRIRYIQQFDNSMRANGVGHYRTGVVHYPRAEKE
ncbi:MAG: hypothetical protein HY094_03915 [Candidatus Melainabacteria bacterium]|nr:hypothetical protein [Candidatus Melainabacteria bacterium]